MASSGHNDDGGPLLFTPDTIVLNIKKYRKSCTGGVFLEYQPHIRNPGFHSKFLTHQAKERQFKLEIKNFWPRLLAQLGICSMEKKEKKKIQNTKRITFFTMAPESVIKTWAPRMSLIWSLHCSNPVHFRSAKAAAAAAAAVI